MLNLIFIFIGGGLFVGGQFTPELKSCGSIFNKALDFVSPVICFDKVDIDPKIGIFSRDTGDLDIGGLLELLGLKSDGLETNFKLLPLPDSPEDWTLLHFLQYGSLVVDGLIVILLVCALVQMRSQCKGVTAAMCTLTGIGAGFVVFWAYKIELKGCPDQKLGYSFYILVASAVSFLISSITSCASATTRTTSTIKYVY